MENIDLSDNQLKQLPRDIARLKNLKQINLSYNKNINTRQVLSILSRLDQLEILMLAENNIKTLPESIVKMQNLKELHLQFNPINEAERKNLITLLPNTKIIF